MEQVEVKQIEVSRTFEAPLELLWKAWTEPERFMQWYGPKEAKRYYKMDELQGVADMASEDIKNIRENIARLLRPAPKIAIRKKVKRVS